MKVVTVVLVTPTTSQQKKKKAHTAWHSKTDVPQDSSAKASQINSGSLTFAIAT
jgi:hypothetical protein